MIAAGNDALFARLSDVLQLPLAEDPRFATNPARCENARLLKRLIEAVTLGSTKDHWIALLSEAGIPTGPIQTVDEVLQDPQILARNMVVDVLGEDGRSAYTAAGNPIKDEWPARSFYPSPRPGAGWQSGRDSGLAGPGRTQAEFLTAALLNPHSKVIKSLKMPPAGGKMPRFAFRLPQKAICSAKNAELRRPQA